MSDRPLWYQHMSRRRWLLAAGSSWAYGACGSPFRTGVPVPVYAGVLQTPVAPQCLSSVRYPVLIGQRGELCSFDELARATPVIYEAQSEPQLSALLCSVPEGKTVTFRGAGQSLDAQALNHDIVVVMSRDHFADIGEPEQNERGTYQVTVGAAARWFDVIQKVAPLGLFPPSLVTSPDATVGGTLSADCVSRLSCTSGKEGEQVRSFNIVLPSGEHRICRRDATDCEERRLFHAVIGGFGYLGAVTRVTFELMAIRSYPNKPGEVPVVETRSTRHASNVDWDVVLKRLRSLSEINRSVFLENMQRKGERGPQPKAQAPQWPALSIASYLTGYGMSANLLEQRFVEKRPLRRAPGGIYDGSSSFAAGAAYAAATFPTVAEFALDMAFPDGAFIDDLMGWSFFIGNVANGAKRMAAEKNERFNFTQQSFALPAQVGARDDTRPTQRFIELMRARLHRARLHPLNIDFLYTPADKFLLSASRGLPAFVVTIAFAGKNQRELSPAVADVLMELSRDCRVLGGRVHLVKNVIADADDLRAMHGDAARQLRELKKQYDPKNILRNQFFDKVFAG